VELRIHADELQQALDGAVADALGDHFDLDRPLAVDEPTAARLLGLATHQLRDLRLKGEIAPRRAGRGHLYSKRCLLEFLNSHLD
jgi:helix-turn-helix protein